MGVYEITACNVDSLSIVRKAEEIPVTRKTIAIDPGHGDKNDSNTVIDPGAVNGTFFEKDFVLDISNAVKSKLEAKGYSVIMTRTGDVYDIGERLRWRIDAAAGKDIFVSIHNDASDNRSARGFSVLYKKNDHESRKLAQAILDSNTLFRGRRIIESTNYVLRNFSGQSVLVEAGFISNEDDLTILKTKTEEVGQEVAAGIINYLEGP